MRRYISQKTCHNPVMNSAMYRTVTNVRGSPSPVGKHLDLYPCAVIFSTRFFIFCKKSGRRKFNENDRDLYLFKIHC